MSYCVNCGVRLEEGRESCPLCGTPVINPNGIGTKNGSMYPADKTGAVRQKISRFNKLVIITLLFLLPVIVIAVCDLSLNGAITWSGYALGALLVFYVVIAFPNLMKSRHIFVTICLDCFAVLVYLFFIVKRTGGEWYTPFALPLTLLFFICVLAFSMLVERRRFSVFLLISAASAILAGFCVCTEMLVNSAFLDRTRLVWSQYPLSTLLVISAFFFFTEKCEPLKEKLRKWFFI